MCNIAQTNKWLEYFQRIQSSAFISNWQLSFLFKSHRKKGSRHQTLSSFHWDISLWVSRLSNNSQCFNKSQQMLKKTQHNLFSSKQENAQTCGVMKDARFHSCKTVKMPADDSYTRADNLTMTFWLWRDFNGRWVLCDRLLTCPECTLPHAKCMLGLIPGASGMSNEAEWIRSGFFCLNSRTVFSLLWIVNSSACLLFVHVLKSKQRGDWRDWKSRGEKNEKTCQTPCDIPADWAASPFAPICSFLFWLFLWPGQRGQPTGQAMRLSSLRTSDGNLEAACKQQPAESEISPHIHSHTFDFIA